VLCEHDLVRVLSILHATKKKLQVLGEGLVGLCSMTLERVQAKEAARSEEVDTFQSGGAATGHQWYEAWLGWFGWRGW